MCLAWHNNGKHIVTGGADSTIHIINVPSVKFRNTITLDGYKEKTSVVWDIKFINDSLFVSANSSGKVQIWDFHTSTLQSHFSVHAGDVLTLAVRNGERTDYVFASGVDSNVLQLSRVKSAVDKYDTQSKWIPSGKIRPHQHDVFSIHISPHGILASGGVEGNLVITDTYLFKNTGYANNQPFPCLPQHFKLAKAGDILLFQDIRTVQLWNISPAIVEHSSVPPRTNSSSLPMCDTDSKGSIPICLLELKNKPPHNILSSAISPDACRIAVSNAFEMWIYSFSNSKHELSLVSNCCYPSSFMLFAPNEHKLLLATTTEGIKSVTCGKKGQSIVKDISDMAVKQFELSTDGQYLAALTKYWKIHILDLHNCTSITEVPTLPELPVTMAFNLSKPELIMSSSGNCHQIFAYDIVNHTFQCLGGLRKNNTFKPHTKLNNPLSLLTISKTLFSMHCNDGVFLCNLHTEKKQSTMLTSTQKRLHQENSVSTQQIHSSSIVVFVGVYYKKEQPTMIFVETSRQAILQTLPPTLHRKCFGV